MPMDIGPQLGVVRCRADHVCLNSPSATRKTAYLPKRSAPLELARFLTVPQFRDLRPDPPPGAFLFGQDRVESIYDLLR